MSPLTYADSRLNGKQMNKHKVSPAPVSPEDSQGDAGDAAMLVSKDESTPSDSNLSSDCTEKEQLVFVGSPPIIPEELSTARSSLVGGSLHSHSTRRGDTETRQPGEQRREARSHESSSRGEHTDTTQREMDQVPPMHPYGRPKRYASSRAVGPLTLRLEEKERQRLQQLEQQQLQLQNGASGTPTTVSSLTRESIKNTLFQFFCVPLSSLDETHKGGLDMLANVKMRRIVPAIPSINLGDESNLTVFHKFFGPSLANKMFRIRRRFYFVVALLNLIMYLAHVSITFLIFWCPTRWRTLVVCLMCINNIFMWLLTMGPSNYRLFIDIMTTFDAFLLFLEAGLGFACLFFMSGAELWSVLFSCAQLVSIVIAASYDAMPRRSQSGLRYSSMLACVSLIVFGYLLFSRSVPSLIDPPFTIPISASLNPTVHVADIMPNRMVTVIILSAKLVWSSGRGDKQTTMLRSRLMVIKITGQKYYRPRGSIMANKSAAFPRQHSRTPNKKGKHMMAQLFPFISTRGQKVSNEQQDEDKPRKSNALLDSTPGVKAIPGPRSPSGQARASQVGINDRDKGASVGQGVQCPAEGAVMSKSAEAVSGALSTSENTRDPTSAPSPVKKPSIPNPRAPLLTLSLDNVPNSGALGQVAPGSSTIRSRSQLPGPGLGNPSSPLRSAHSNDMKTPRTGRRLSGRTSRKPSLHSQSSLSSMLSSGSSWESTDGDDADRRKHKTRTLLPVIAEYDLEIGPRQTILFLVLGEKVGEAVISFANRHLPHVFTSLWICNIIYSLCVFVVLSECFDELASDVTSADASRSQVTKPAFAGLMLIIALVIHLPSHLASSNIQIVIMILKTFDFWFFYSQYVLVCICLCAAYQWTAWVVCFGFASLLYMTSLLLYDGNCPVRKKIWSVFRIVQVVKHIVLVFLLAMIGSVPAYTTAGSAHSIAAYEFSITLPYLHTDFATSDTGAVSDSPEQSCLYQPCVRRLDLVEPGNVVITADQGGQMENATSRNDGNGTVGNEKQGDEVKTGGEYISYSYTVQASAEASGADIAFRDEPVITEVPTILRWAAPTMRYRKFKFSLLNIAVNRLYTVIILLLKLTVISLRYPEHLPIVRTRMTSFYSISGQLPPTETSQAAHGALPDVARPKVTVANPKPLPSMPEAVAVSNGI